MKDHEQAPGNLPENNPGTDKFVSDTQKVVHRHLSDPNHHISEDDIKNVRVGMTPPDSRNTAENLNENVEKRVEKISDEIEAEGKDEDDIPPQDDRITPWDITT